MYAILALFGPHRKFFSFYFSNLIFLAAFLKFHCRDTGFRIDHYENVMKSEEDQIVGEVGRCARVIDT